MVIFIKLIITGFWETWTNSAITELILERIQQGK